MPDDTESYFVSLAVQRGVATREAAQHCLELARSPQAAGRSVMHILVERARIPTDVARGLHQEAVALAGQARHRGSDLQRWVSGSSSSVGPGLHPAGAPTPAPGAAPTLAPHGSLAGSSPGAARDPLITPTTRGAPAVHSNGPGGPVPGTPWPVFGAHPVRDGTNASSHPQASFSLRSRTFNPGENFDRYRLESELGRGGMGVVWRARHLDLDRPVAIKMLLTGTSADDRRRTRFMAEARAVAKLMHPNLVAVHDVGEFEGVLYFTMDLVDGPSLSDALKQSPFDLRRSLEVARGIAQGLACAHAQQLVHRDLKPANILLDPRGGPKITDFGIAKDLGAQNGQTQAGEVLGTPAYMPPEQADGRTNLVDCRADIYALGAIIYRMVAGRPPFEGATPYDVITKVLTVDPVPLRKLDRKVPEAVDEIVMRCLAKDRDQRYPTAEALATDLSAALEALDAADRPAVERGRGGGAAPTTGMLVLAVGAILIAAAGAGVGVYAWVDAKKQKQALLDQAAREEAARRAAAERQRLVEAAEKREAAKELAEQALARQRDNPQEALGMAREAVELAPDSVDALVALGKLLLTAGSNAAKAAEALDTALRLQPDHLGARVARARCWLALGRAPSDIEAEANHLDRLGSPGRAAAAELRAELALAKKELAVAVVHLDEAVHLDDKNVALRLRLAELLLLARRFSAADEEATAALRLERSAAAYLVRATARKELGRTADALADAEEALRLDKDDAQARALAAALRPRTQQPPPTQPVRQPERGDHGTHEAVHAALKALREAMARKDNQEVNRQLGLALEMRDVPCATALHDRAAVLIDVQRFQEAAADIDRLYALQGDGGQVHLLRAALFVRTNRLDDAERSFARAIELEPRDFHVHEVRARFYESRDDAEKAAADWDQVVAKAPPAKRGWLHHERAHFLQRRGQLDRALVDMNTALELDETEGHMWLVRGELHAEMGNKAHAIADLQEALRVGLRGAEETRAKKKLQELGS